MPITQFQKVMLDLDVALTGHAPVEVGRQIHHQPESVEAWLTQIASGNPTYYLSDGGYSRVVFGLDGGRLFLTSNSRDQVKARWETARQQIEAAEHFIRSEINRMEPGFYESRGNFAQALASALLEDHEEIAVDLDGTLAKDSGWKGISHIGDPVPKMLKRVQKWIDDGKKVVIFTARAHDPRAIPHIEKWLKKHGLPQLEVTNEKRPSMVSFWDDKAVAVKRNRGIEESRAKEHILAEDPVLVALFQAAANSGQPLSDIDGIEVYGMDPETGRAEPGTGHVFGVSVHFKRHTSTTGGLEDIGEYGTKAEAMEAVRKLTLYLPDTVVIDELSGNRGIEETIKTLRDFRRYPDDQKWLCHDASVAERHKLKVPFECGSRLWLGGGIVQIEFYSNRGPQIFSGRRFQDTDQVPAKTLTPADGTWQFDEAPSW